MLKRISRVLRAAAASWSSKPVDELPARRYTTEAWCRALARVIIAAASRQHLASGDTIAHHIVSMRRYQISPSEYVARVTGLSKEVVLAQARSHIESELLEVAVLPGSGWTLPNIEVGLAAATSAAPPAPATPGRRR